MPAGLGIDFEAHGEVQISRELMRFGEAVRNPRPLWRNLYDYFLGENRRNFDSQGRRGSSGWAPLAASTLEAKRRTGLDLRILHATLALRDSLTKKGGDNQTAIFSLNQFVFGSTLPYAGFHQKGTSRMPRRAPMEFREAARREAVKRTQRYVLTGKI